MAGRYYAGLVLANVNHKRQRIEFLVQEAEYVGGRRETKNAGGMEEPEDHGDPVRTLRREIRHELQIQIRGVIKPQLLVHVPESDSPEKYFYFAWFGDCNGRLRTTPKDDGEDTLLHPPRWVTFGEYKKLLIRTHQPVIQELERLGYR